MAPLSSWTGPAAAAGSSTRAIRAATRGSPAARCNAETAARSTSGRPPPVMIAKGSKPLVSGGAARRSSSSTQPLGTPLWRAVSTRRASARTSSIPGGSGRKENMVMSLPMVGDAARPYGDRVRFSISIHQLDTGRFDAAGVRDYLARAEELGVEAGWVLEQIIGPAPLIAPLVLVDYAAARTEPLRLVVA